MTIKPVNEIVRSGGLDAFDLMRRDIGSRIAAMREEQGMTALELADAVGVSEALIKALESGKKPGVSPGLHLICRIAVALGCRAEIRLMKITKQNE